MISGGGLEGMIERVRKAKSTSNALDIEIEIALFEPDRRYASVKTNAAGTKLIYTTHDGKPETFWAPDHTLNSARRNAAIALLRSIKDRE